MRNAKKVVSLRLDEDLCSQIQDKAESMGISFSAVVRIAIKEKLNENLGESGNNIAATSDEMIKAAILLLAQGSANEDEIVDMLGKPAASFSREETRKVSKTARSAKVDSKKVRKPDREVAAETSMTMEQPLKTEGIPIAAVKPLTQQAEVPKSISPAARVNDEDNDTENEQENIIEVSESTDVAFSEDIMANLDSMLGL